MTEQATFDLYAEPEQGLRRAQSPRSGWNSRDGSKASKRAAIAITPKSGSQRFAVLEAVVKGDTHGVTQWEIVESAGLLRSSVCGRIRELEVSGYVIKGDKTRFNEAHKSDESIYFATTRGERAVRKAS